ncbi:MAG: DNA polymerase III, partial [Candidatus Omnitrophota bacterium]|nr:DNA polymerase III [Candidatus Omnitrophota bacterium]
YELGYEKIFKAATDTGTAIEINAYPKRLDLTDIHCRRAKELGVKLAITTDAHARPQFDNIIYGVGTARRAWLSKSDILNCMALKEIRKFVNKKRA